MLTEDGSRITEFDFSPTELLPEVQTAGESPIVVSSDTSHGKNFRVSQLIPNGWFRAALVTVYGKLPEDS